MSVTLIVIVVYHRHKPMDQGGISAMLLLYLSDLDCQGPQKIPVILHVPHL
jgi:hypothetical protein